MVGDEVADSVKSSTTTRGTGDRWSTWASTVTACRSG